MAYLGRRRPHCSSALIAPVLFVRDYLWHMNYANEGKRLHLFTGLLGFSIFLWFASHSGRCLACRLQYRPDMAIRHSVHTSNDKCTVCSLLMTLWYTVCLSNVPNGAVNWYVFLLADDPEGSFVPPELDTTGSTFEVRDDKCPYRFCSGHSHPWDRTPLRHLGDVCWGRVWRVVLSFFPHLKFPTFPQQSFSYKLTSVTSNL